MFLSLDSLYNAKDLAGYTWAKPTGKFNTESMKELTMALCDAFCNDKSDNLVATSGKCLTKEEIVEIITFMNDHPMVITTDFSPHVVEILTGLGHTLKVFFIFGGELVNIKMAEIKASEAKPESETESETEAEPEAEEPEADEAEADEEDEEKDVLAELAEEFGEIDFDDITGQGMSQSTNYFY